MPASTVKRRGRHGLKMAFCAGRPAHRWHLRWQRRRGLRPGAPRGQNPGEWDPRPPKPARSICSAASTRTGPRSWPSGRQALIHRCPRRCHHASGSISTTRGQWRSTVGLRLVMVDRGGRASRAELAGASPAGGHARWRLGSHPAWRPPPAPTQSSRVREAIDGPPAHTKGPADRRLPVAQLVVRRRRDGNLCNRMT